MWRAHFVAEPDRAPAKAGSCGRLALLVMGLSVLLSQSQPAMAVDRLPCRAPEPLVTFEAPLRGFARAVERGREIRVVALGSSSTEGTGASTKQAAYPARFDQEMDRRFPGKDFQVANLGRGGELADTMLMRLVRDVIPARPALVLWQTGVNDAIAGVDLAVFSKILISGIAALKAANIEVVLVDPQYYPRSAGVPRYEEYVAVMRRVALEHRVPVFRRYAIMQHLIASGQHSVDGLLWEDKFHLNDTSYRCLAQLMAEAVEGEIRRSTVPMISADAVTARPLTGWSPMAAY
jgi:acyl-CoA thioesterase I